MASIADEKLNARKAAFARRKLAHQSGIDATENLVSAIAGLPGEVVAGYWPIRTEIDPREALTELSKSRQIVLPVVLGDGQPLEFRLWAPGAEMIEGAFGAAIPANTDTLDPDVVIVPLSAYDLRGYRLGYGGGFYDRTLEQLRSIKPMAAIGFAYSAQQTDSVPIENTDQPLDGIVTELGYTRF